MRDSSLAGVLVFLITTSRPTSDTLAVFSALLAQEASFIHGMRTSLLIAAAVALVTAMTSLLLRKVQQSADV